jgi:putative transcriptional regulator
MIRIKYKQYLDDKNFKDRRRYTIADITEITGISRGTLQRIANTPGYNATLDSIDALCKFFECTPGELLEFIPDED